MLKHSICALVAGSLLFAGANALADEERVASVDTARHEVQLTEEESNALRDLEGKEPKSSEIDPVKDASSVCWFPICDQYNCFCPW